MLCVSILYPYIDQKKCDGHLTYLFDNRKMKPIWIYRVTDLFPLFGFHLCMLLHYIMCNIKLQMSAPLPSIYRSFVMNTLPICLIIIRWKPIRIYPVWQTFFLCLVTFVYAVALYYASKQARKQNIKKWSWPNHGIQVGGGSCYSIEAMASEIR